MSGTLPSARCTPSAKPLIFAQITLIRFSFTFTNPLVEVYSLAKLFLRKRY